MKKLPIRIGNALLLTAIAILIPYSNWAGTLQASINADRVYLPVIQQGRAVEVNTVVPASYPLTFDLIDPNSYRSYPLFGSATLADRDIVVRVYLHALPGPNAPQYAANGIFFGNYNQRVYLVYQDGSWTIMHGAGDSYNAKKLPGMTTPYAQLTLRLSQQNRMATAILPNGARVELDLGRSIFSPNETLYLFAQTAPDSVTRVYSAQIEQQPTSQHDRLLAQADPPLRSLTARHDITFGAIHDTDALGAWLDFELLDRHANLQVVHLNWRSSQANTPFVYEDALHASTRIAHAKAVGQRVRIHPLIWHEDFPEWLKNGNFSNNELEDIMRERITSLMRKHQAEEWVVVNEPITDTVSAPALRNHVFKRAFGEEYLDMAFRFARAADPNAVLIYNDYGVEGVNTKSDRMYNLLRRMLDRGVPIDGVGLQFHMLGCEGTSTPTKGQYKENMARFAALGLDIYITELDVNLNGLSGNRDEKWLKQAAIYRDATEACLETPACQSVTTWGLRDSTSWWYRFPAEAPCGDDPLIFDDNYSPKPAYKAIQNALAGQSTPTPVPPNRSGIQLEAEEHDGQSGVETYDTFVGYADQGDWIRFDDVYLADHYTTMKVRYAKGNDTNTRILIHLGGLSNPPVAHFSTRNTGGWDRYREETKSININAIGTHDIYFSFDDGAGAGNIDWIAFEKSSSSWVNTLPRTTFKSDNVTTILAEPVNWGIGNYTDHIAGDSVEGSATIYFDDAAVSTQPLHLFASASAVR